jgi:cold shock protein
MRQGRVKFFDDARGYGFVTPSDGTADVFVHVSNLKATRPLVKGDRVSYELERNPRNPTKFQATTPKA